MACLDGNCRDGFQGTVVDNVIDILAPLTNEGKFMIHVFAKKWEKLGRLFFDEESKLEGETQFKAFKFKDFTQGRFSNVVRTNSDCQFEWREEVVCTPSTTVATNAADEATTLVVADVAKLLGIGAKSEVIIATATGKIIRATVASVNTGTDTITLASPWLSGAVVVGDVVYRGAYARDVACNSTIANTYSYRQARKYTSYFRKISGSLDFASCDLSLDRYVGNGKSSAEIFIKMKENAVLEGLAHEMVMAFFLDTNEELASGARTTQGLLPALQAAQTAGSVNLLTDYSDCCTGDTDAEKEIATRKMIGGFLATIVDVHQSGMYDTPEVTVLINNKQAQALALLSPYFNDYHGVQLFKDVSNGTGYGLDIPNVSHMGININFMYESFLDTVFPNTPVHIMLPRNAVYVVQRDFPLLTTNGKDIETIKSMNEMVNNGYPLFRVVDRSNFVGNGMGDCFTFYYEAEFAIAWAGIDKGAYRLWVGFGACTDFCDTCALSTHTIF